MITKIYTCDCCHRESRDEGFTQQIELRIGDEYCDTRPYYQLTSDWCDECLKRARLLSRNELRDLHANKPAQPTIEDIVQQMIDERVQEAINHA